MCEENTLQEERFLQEVEQKLLRKELDARLLEGGLIRVKWNGQPLCSVDRDGIVRFRPADITGPEVDRQLRTVIQTAGHVKEYMRIFERAPALKAIGLEDSYKVLADFGDAVLAGRSCKTGAKFVTWEWDFDRQGVHAGHYVVETEHYEYCLRCNPVPGDYQAHLLCYDLNEQKINHAYQPLIGRVHFINGDAQQFTDAKEYLDCIREELPHEATTGFRFRTITQDPAVRKAVDDIVFDLYGEENPCNEEDYNLAPSEEIQMGGM